MNLRLLRRFLCFLCLFGMIVLLGESVFSFAVSPLMVEIEIETNEKKCVFFWFKSIDEEILINDKWNLNGGNNILDYKNTSEEFGISIDYEKITEEKYEVCFISKNPGEYHGAILFREKNSIIEMGSWIFLNVTSDGDLEEDERRGILTGGVIKELGREDNLGRIIVLVSLFIILVLILIIILKIKKRQII